MTPAFGQVLKAPPPTFTRIPIDPPPLGTGIETGPFDDQVLRPFAGVGPVNRNVHELAQPASGVPPAASSTKVTLTCLGLMSGTASGRPPVAAETWKICTRACAFAAGSTFMWKKFGTNPKKSGSRASVALTSTISAWHGGCATVSSGAGPPGWEGL